MDTLILMLVGLALLSTLGLFAVLFGEDSRDPIGDDHARRVCS